MKTKTCFNACTLRVLDFCPKMQAQKLTLPFNILTPLNFSRSPHILPSLPPLQYPSSNLAIRVNPKSGFFQFSQKDVHITNWFWKTWRRGYDQLWSERR